MKKAALVQFISKYFNYFVQLGITAILARLIVPEDFGVLAIVTVFLAFFSTFSDMGLSTAIIQFELTDREIEALFGFSLLAAIVLCSLFCAVSAPISWFYGDERLAPLCCISSISLLFATLNMVPNGILLKQLKFVSVGLRLVVASIVSGAVAVALAFWGFGTYALVLQVVISSAVVFIWNIAVVPIRRINFHFAGVLKKIIGYSSYQFGFTLINYFSRNLDNLLIGKVMGATALGYYDKAYKLTTYPTGALAGVISPVIQPFMARLQECPDEIFRVFVKVVRLLSIGGAFVAAAMVSCADEVVLLFYGTQWEQSIPLFQILAVTIYVQILANPASPFFQSLGRTDLQFRVGLINTIITLVSLSGGLISGDLIILTALIALAFLSHLLVMGWFLVVKGFGKGFGFAVQLVPEICTAIIACLTCYSVTSFMPATPVISLAIKLLVVIAVFGIGYRVTGRIDYVKSILSRKRSD